MSPTECKGFTIERIDYEGSTIYETLYALLHDGTVIKTDEHKRTNEFGGKGRRWFATGHDFAWLKENAEFIGSYPTPSTRI